MHRPANLSVPAGLIFLSLRLVIAGDPVRDLAALQALDKGLLAVMKNGRFY
jgi:hypothetical protein